MARLIFIIILLPVIAFAISPNTRVTQDFIQANQLYQQENYSEAIQLYENILKSGFESGTLYYNLGNSYYKSGKLGKAILYYEKAQRFLPRDDDLNSNLKLAQLRVADKVEAPRLVIWKILDTIRDHFTANDWAQLTLLFYLMTLVLSAVYYFLPRSIGKRIAFYISLPLLILFVISSAFFASKLWHEHNIREAIIMVEKVEIVSAPDEGAKGLFSLHEGVKVSIKQELPPWAEIALPDGKRGWVKQDSFEVL